MRFKPIGCDPFSLSSMRHGGEGWGEEAACFETLVVFSGPLYAAPMKPTVTARQLRRDQTQEEKELWRALRAGRFAGFKFRRQHPLGKYFLDFYCPIARLSVELDGFQHGLPQQRIRDEAREQFLTVEGIEELRFWNHQWRRNCEGVLLEIWEALHRRTGCVQVLRKVQNNRYVPPDAGQLIVKPPLPSPLLHPMEEREKK
jgi:very-short-patch-repair endonuclease